MMSSICRARRLCACRVEDRYFLKYRRELQSECSRVTGLNPISQQLLDAEKGVAVVEWRRSAKNQTECRFRAMPRCGIQTDVTVRYSRV